ncbi:MAG: S41 family peptidase [Bacteroidetes bacterium]|nr:S41 family peptidase [Bacteroidota bacterium]
MGSKKLQTWIPFLFSIVMVLGMWIGYQLKANTNGGVQFLTNAKTNSLQEVLNIIQKDYVDPVSIDSLRESAIEDMLSHLDPHSIYIPAKDLQGVNEEMQGNFQGIGIEFQIFNDTVNVMSVIPGGPAYKAGMQAGDEILTVNDSIRLTGKNIKADDIKNSLRGPGNSTVKITARRNDQIMSFRVQRGIIPLPSVDVAYMIAPQTGYIHINKFSETTYREFMSKLDSMQQKGMQKLILDLRGNGGGIVTEATNIADEFLDDTKMIVYTKGDKVAPTEIRAIKDGLFEKGKLVILIDENSASATEILAGALQDWDRATIIGRRSFGKGLVQQQFPLSDGGALRLTIARYYTPLGRSLQKSYAGGKDKYEEEVIDRFEDGEVVHGDTSQPIGKAFKTPGGHVVYDGGGITPDIFIPFDTASQPHAVILLYMKNTLNNFVYHYFLQHKNLFTAIKSPDDLMNQFKPGESEWNQLVSFAKKDTINLDKIPASARISLLEKMQALMARQLWRTQGFYEVDNHYDPTVQKALEITK